MTPPDLDSAVRSIMDRAVETYRDSPRTVRRLRRARKRLDGPLRLAVVGPARSGKSTMVNALVGADVAPVEALGSRGLLVWYRDGPAPAVTVYPAGEELDVTTVDNGLRVEPERWPADPVDEVVVDWPSRTLRHTLLIDTPALGAAGPDPGVDVTLAEVCEEADALLYLTRDVSGADLGLLRSVQDGRVAPAAPVHTVVVLSRADETGGGRVDALTSARQIARRYRRDVAARELCQHVVSVAALVGHAGRTLREAEFDRLAGLAALPREELADRLLSTDRFLAAAPDGPDRTLLERFGIFGIRLATTLIRTRCDSTARLSAELVSRSGLTELRETVGRLFLDRRKVLQARSALLALEQVLRVEPRPAAGPLVVELERILAAAHEFRELRLIGALHTGRVTLPEELAGPARALIGACGTSVAHRLGCDGGAADADLWTLATRALDQWRECAESPAFGQEQRRAAAVVRRSCEEIVTRLSHRTGPADRVASRPG